MVDGIDLISNQFFIGITAVFGVDKPELTQGRQEIMMEDDEVSRKAKRELEKLSEDGGLLNAPRLKKKSKTVRGHFSADDVDADDPVELWGTRIARGLSLIAFIALAIWLYLNYFQN